MNIRTYGIHPFRIAVIHGGPGAPGSVAAIARNLSEHYGVLEPFQTKTTLDGQVSELVETLKTYGDPNSPSILIGHSWGAWLAYLTAVKYPFLVEKLILIGCPPLEEKYVSRLRETRLDRLSDEENNEFQTLIHQLSSLSSEEKEDKYNRLSELVTITDDYDVIDDKHEKEDKVKVKSANYISVWNKAANLRKTGSLIGYANQLKCPVVAIHGDYDPHPAEGVKKPLENTIDDFYFYLLEKCGHSPWKERSAKKQFYKILQREII
ncbi:alpha/beta fold hydrolase [Chengkuizengella marina]|uniref:Alpha/beta hydrolase n=1 Tax=Chengkuizengella marina TaxID=2507566 RepID=A0A6N9Q1B9_9BACL|nr:alpha/beta hydrolase [Chengkuizengella marina]NBI27950.1 alpha/beta hydrolase [Chengkuizengella marina]